MTPVRRCVDCVFFQRQLSGSDLGTCGNPEGLKIGGFAGCLFDGTTSWCHYFKDEKEVPNP